MAGYPDSLLSRKVRGPLADWGVTELLLRQIEFRLAGRVWQGGGGKGKKPQPIELPDARKPRKRPDGAEMARRLHNLGLIPARPGQTPNG